MNFFIFQNIKKLHIHSFDNYSPGHAFLTTFLVEKKDILEELTLTDPRPFLIDIIRNQLNSLKRLHLKNVRLGQLSFLTKCEYDYTLKFLSIGITNSLFPIDNWLKMKFACNFTNRYKGLEVLKVENSKYMCIEDIDDDFIEVNLPMLKTIYITRSDDFMLNCINADNLETVYINNFVFHDYGVNYSTLPTVKNLIIKNLYVGIERILIFYPGLTYLRIDKVINPIFISIWPLERYGKNISTLVIPENSWRVVDLPQNLSHIKLILLFSPHSSSLNLGDEWYY